MRKPIKLFRSRARSLRLWGPKLKPQVEDQVSLLGHAVPDPLQARVTMINVNMIS